jgi:hypothetical protein
VSTISTLIGDAEKIAVELTPPSSVLGRVVGALALQVEQLAGKELKPLAADILGAPAAPAPAPPAPAPPAPAAGSDVDAKINALTEQIQALATAVSAKENAS